MGSTVKTILTAAIMDYKLNKTPSFHLLCLYLIMLSTGILCQQEFTFEYNKDDTESICLDKSTDLMVGDFVLLNGTLDISGKDIGTGPSQYEEHFYVSAQTTPTSPFAPLCSISVRIAACGTQATNCHCTKAVGDVLHFLARYRATSDLSGNGVRAEWTQNQLGGNTITSSVYQIPTVNELEVKRLFVNGVLHELNDITVENGNTYNITWCVDNLHTGSTIDIQLEGKNVNNLPNGYCAEYILKANTESVGKYLNLSYTESGGCGRSEIVNVGLHISESLLGCTIVGECRGFIVGCCISAAVVIILSLVIGIRDPDLTPRRIILIILIVCWVLLLALQIALLVVCIVEKDGDFKDCEVKTGALIVLLITCTGHGVAIVVIIKKSKKCGEAICCCCLEKKSREEPDGATVKPGPESVSMTIPTNADKNDNDDIDGDKVQTNRL